eukprot:CAMPEP_0176341406 /NCGR_PEP_ID=MMETSP0126-20121128/2350_1 /TAXON_ID=141414 ORGANISM="Strombidinopsis acuminatum, Strain SPMC142" /NCGR_SAMPLE_ID=MMETSP0126 /ASSEMBLY_ACC=CAM_ASM_000229 /LENGTH=46 /DNA_ID= /DNA_START= /DNA_END= /DNA_ORIENTATION=
MTYYCATFGSVDFMRGLTIRPPLPPDGSLLLVAALAPCPTRLFAAA